MDWLRYREAIDYSIARREINSIREAAYERALNRADLRVYYAANRFVPYNAAAWIRYWTGTAIFRAPLR